MTTTKCLRSCFVLGLSVAALTGCSGGGMAPAGLSGVGATTQSFGPLTTRVVGTAQAPVTSSASYGANVTAIAGAQVDQLTLTPTGPNTLADTKIVFNSLRGSSDEIFLMNADGTGQTQLTSNVYLDETPSLSPDGTKIVFKSFRDGNSEIYVMNVDGTGQTRLTNNTKTDEYPSWSPDGTKIVYSDNTGNNSDIYIMNANGTGVTRLTSAAWLEYKPRFSPDGKKIVFTSRKNGNADIYVMNIDGSVQKQLTSSTSEDEAPSFSPDGTKIAFSSNRDVWENYEIYVMNANGSDQTRLTTSGTKNYSPQYAPDGSRIVFWSSRDANWEIYSMSAFGGGEVNLSKQPYSSDAYPSWSGYLPRKPKTLVGAGGVLGTASAGFLYGQKAGVAKSVVSYDTVGTTLAERAASRVTAQSAPYNDQGSDLIFSITTNLGLAKLGYVNLSEAGVPGAAVNVAIPTGSTGALVSFVASTGTVGAVIPFAANRSAGLTPVKSGETVTYTGHFTALFDENGKNVAPNGARSVTLDAKNGTLVHFE